MADINIEPPPGKQKKSKPKEEKKKEKEEEVSKGTDQSGICQTFLITLFLKGNKVLKKI